ncbi:MAG: transposase [Clostridia bacterium]|nr:transposase [Clostridia bacterium]
MPRAARPRGEFSTYHIITRGNEKKKIFLDSGDKERFLEILSRVKTKYNFLVYVYCLMDNHLHLIIYDNGTDLSLIMKSLNVSYVSYFNRKHQRVGHLFQDRYKSEPIDDDTYLLELSKYIHNNPVKAGIVKDALEFKWSSFRQYVFGDFHDKNEILSTSKILSILSEKQDVAQQEYYQYVSDSEETIKANISSGFISAEGKTRDSALLMEEASEKINKMAESKGLTVEELINNRKIRDEAIRELRGNSSLKLKEIGELLGGLSESRVSRILKA